MRKYFLGSFVLLGVAGGIAALASSSGVLPRLSVGLSQGSLRISWAGSGTNAVLETTDALGANSRWQPISQTPTQNGSGSSLTVNTADPRRFFRLRLPQLTTVASTSPVDGEGDVSVNRETVVRFSAPLAAAVTLATTNFYADYAGRHLLSRVELSSDRMTASLFYLEPIPGSTRINVTFDGTGITEAGGQLIDADGDGTAGGSKVFSFNTLNTTPVANTAVIGSVFAAEMASSGGGTPKNVPLAGVIITVDGQEESMRAVTDGNGNFVLEPAPAGRFFVKIDGRTVPGTQYPYGAYYPFVGKEWEAIPGKTNNLAGGTGQIFLPLIPSGTLKAVSPTAPTVVSFAPSVVASNAALAGVSITVPPNDLFSDNGNRGGMVGIAPVPPDRLPGPLPLGLQFPLVITIQTDGPENFDVPVPVRFPNLPDPVTGQKLPPGAKSALWSFNYRTGRWEIQGPVTVSADGLYVDSDPGVGVRQPGWHGVNPGTSGNCQDGLPCTGPGPSGPGPGPNGPCDLERQKEWSSSLQCSASFLISLIPGAGCAVGVGQAIAGSAIDCKIDPTSCKTSVASQFIGAALGCIPVFGTAASLAKCMLDTALAHGDYANCLHANGLDSSESAGSGPNLRIGSDPSQIPHNVYSEQAALLQAIGDLANACLGSVKWTQCQPQDQALWTGFMQALSDATQPGSDSGVRISPAESAHLHGLSLPANITGADADALITRIDQMMAGTLPETDFQAAVISSAAAQLVAVGQELQGRGWQTVYDGFVRSLTDLAHADQQAAKSQPGFSGRLYYRVIDRVTGYSQRGRLNSQGKFDTLVLIPNHFHLVEYLDPISLWVGRTAFFSNGNGTQTAIPTTALAPSTSIDSDGDGLPDEVELILGTNPTKADTNGDGISDGAALQQGLNPLDGFPAQTGVLAAAATGGDTADICIRGELAAVAALDKGFYLFDIHETLNPTLLAQVPSGLSTKKVALVGRTLCVGDDFAGLLLYDVSNPAKPVATHQMNLGGVANAIISLGDRACVAVNDSILLVDAATGMVTDRHQYSSGQIHDLAIAGDRLYSVSVPSGNEPHVINRFDLTDTLPSAPAVTLTVNGHPTFGRIHLFAGSDGIIYVGAVDNNDISGPTGQIPGIEILKDTGAALELLGAPSPVIAFNVAATGSGLVVFTGTDAGLQSSAKIGLLDVSNPSVTSNFVARLDVAGTARGLALHNGLAYVSTSQGLQIVNYLPFDQKGIAPAIALDASFSLTGLQAESGKLARLTALATDDVQVRSVEFYQDGALAQIADHYPFDYHFRVPLLASGKTSFTLRAKASDTGGNFTWSDLLTLTIVDTTAPVVTSTEPATNAVLFSGKLSALTAVFSESLSPASVKPDAIQLVSAGADNTFGTADDIALGAMSASYDAAHNAVLFQLAAPLGKGLYRATINKSITDLVGNVVSPDSWNFEVRDPDVWQLGSDGFWDVASNWAGASVPKNNDLVTIDHPGGTITYRNATTVLVGLQSTASLVMTDGALTLQQDSTIAGDFTLAGGTLTLQGLLTVKGTFTYTGGAVNGGGKLVTAGGLVLHTSNGALQVGPAILEGAGTGTWFGNSAVLFQDKTSSIVNDQGAVLTDLDGAVMAFSGFQGPYPKFINNGTFVKSGGTNTTYFNSVEFDNNGLVEVQAGTLTLAGGGVGSGQFQVAAGATLDFNGATNSLTPGSSITGAGQVTFSTGNISLAGPYDITGGTSVGDSSGGFSIISVPTTFGGSVHIAGSFNIYTYGQAVLNGDPINIECPVNLNGGTLTVNSTKGPVTLTSLTASGGRISGSTDLIVTGPVHLSSGTSLSGPGRLTAQSEIEFDGTINLSGSLIPGGGPGRVIDNVSNCVLTATSTVQTGSNNTFNNLAGALFDMQGDGFFGGGGVNNSVFNNAGTFRKSGGTGKGQVSPLFMNSGTLNVHSGSLGMLNGLIQTSGQTLLNGGTLTGYPFLDFEGGLVLGPGTFDIPFLTNACQFSTGSGIGQLKATTYYVQTPQGSLTLKLGGTMPGVGYDQFVVQNQATLAGTLNLSLVNGYKPNIGDAFQVLTCASRTGTFTTVNGLAIGGGQKLVVSYSSTAVTVTVAASP